MRIHGLFQDKFSDLESYRQDIRTVLKIMNNGIKSNQIKLKGYELWRKELITQLATNKDYIKSIGTVYDSKYDSVSTKLDRVDDAVEKQRHSFASMMYDLVDVTNNFKLLEGKVKLLENDNQKRLVKEAAMEAEKLRLQMLAMTATTTEPPTTTTMATTTTAATTTATTTMVAATTTTPAPIIFDTSLLESKISVADFRSTTNAAMVLNLNASVVDLGNRLQGLMEGQAYLIQKLQKATSSIDRSDYRTKKILSRIDDLREIYQSARDELSNRSSTAIFEFISEVDKFNEVIDNRNIVDKSKFKEVDIFGVVRQKVHKIKSFRFR